MQKLVCFLLVFMSISVSAYATDCNNGGRYEDNGDWTVTDCRTGLIWLVLTNCPHTAGGIDKSNGYLSWYDAMKWVAGLGNGICNLTDGSAPGDWRLPTKTEWMAMIASAKKQGFTFPILTDGAGTAPWSQGNVFYDVQSFYYWSSTTYANNTNHAWDVYMGEGEVGHYNKTDEDYVWPVRGGQSGSFGSLIIQ